MDALRELFAKFEVEVDSKGELKKGDREVENLIGTLKEGVKIFAEAFAVDKIKEFVMGQVEAALALDRTAARLGMTTQKMEEFRLAAGLAGVDADEASGLLGRLNRTVGEAALKGGDAAAVFQRLGIQLKENGQVRETGDIVEDLADKISKMPDASGRARVAFELFGRQGARLLPLLQKGREGFDEARKAMAELGGGTSKEFIESSKKVEEAQVRLKFVWGNLSQVLAGLFLPRMIKTAEMMTKVVRGALDLTKHTHILHTAFTALAVVAAFKATQQIGELAKKMGLLKGSVTETVAALARFAIPLVVVGLLYLLFDELYTLLKGGNTIIGQTVDSFLGFGAANDVAMALRQTWRDIKAIFHDVYDIAVKLGNVLGNLPTFLGADIRQDRHTAAEQSDQQKQVQAAGADTVDALSAAWKDLKDTINRPGTAKAWQDVGHRKPWFDEGNQGPHPSDATPMPEYTPPQGTSVTLGPAFGVATQLTVHQEMNFVNAPGDPQAVRKAAGQGVADANQRAHYNANVSHRKP